MGRAGPTDSNALQPLIDRQAIVDVTVDYCWILDHRHHAELGQVFMPDAVADYHGEVYEGIEAIVSKIDTALSRFDSTHHLVANHQIRVDGDAATSSCYLWAQHVRDGIEGGHTYLVAGRYDDRLLRTPVGWRISERVLVIDWTDGNPDLRKFSE